MSGSEKTPISKREKTMLTSFLISASGPIVTGITAITSRSATQIADFLRRTAELLALFTSWWVYRKLYGKTESDPEYCARMENIADATVLGAMFCSGIVMLAIGISRLFVYKVSGNVILGLITATMGLLVNAWFWRRYSIMIREEFDSIVAGQQRLYRAKVFVDIAVVTALASVTIAPNHPAIRYIDALGCIIVSFYLLYNGFGII